MTLASAIALGLIMCLHGPTLPKHWLFDLGVPWFFFASGVWYVKGSLEVWKLGSLEVGYVEQVWKRVRTLLLPYFLWNLIWFPILFVCNWIGWKYCGAMRVVDGSPECIIRCLGLSPFAWPALVPTWFLRALFVAVVIVGGMRGVKAWKFRGLEGWGGALAFWGIYLSRGLWMPEGPLWEGFFTFGIPLLGCACFATGAAFGEKLGSLDDWKLGPLNLQTSKHPSTPAIALIRRQMMPVYILHAAVIVSIGWVAKATGFWGPLATITGDVVMWFVGIAGSVAIGEALRRFAPRAASVLFGGR